MDVTSLLYREALWSIQKGVAADTAAAEEAWLEKRVCWLLYNRTLSRSKRRTDKQKGLKEAEVKGLTEGDRDTEERYRAELEILLESGW